MNKQVIGCDKININIGFCTYGDYVDIVTKMYNRTYNDNEQLIASGLIVKTEVSTNGEPYRMLSESEFKDKVRSDQLRLKSL